MSTSDYVNTFRERGVLRLEECFTLAEVDKIRAQAILSLCDQPQLEIREGYPTLMYWPDIETPNTILEIAEDVLGSDFEQVNKQIYFHLPGDPDEFAWHTDSRFWPEAKDYLQTAIIIDEWTRDNTVEFLSESVQWDDKNDLRKFKRMGYNGTKVLAKPGDVVIWSHKIVHGSQRNKTRNPRMYFMNGFLTQ